eukprot:6071054-Amphidinium_carterae.1
MLPGTVALANWRLVGPQLRWVRTDSNPRVRLPPEVPAEHSVTMIVMTMLASLEWSSWLSVSHCCLQKSFELLPLTKASLFQTYKRSTTAPKVPANMRRMSNLIK